MVQKTDPFVGSFYGWANGEDAWGEGMNENLLQYSFFHSRNLDAVLSNSANLPLSPVEGYAAFTENDKKVYLRVDGVWHSFSVPNNMTFVRKSDGAKLIYNGTTLVPNTISQSDITGLTASLAAKVNTSSVGAINGVAPLGADGKVPAANLPEGGSYSGTWNASTNTPTIVSGVGVNGQFYKVAVSGSTNIDGIDSWSIGDEIRFSGTVWQRIPNSAQVSSVNGQTGDVVLSSASVGAAPLSHVGSGGSSHAAATTSTAGFMSSGDKSKLDGVASGATANQSDAFLLSRANHTGTQPQASVTNLTTDLASKQATLVSGTNIKTINGNSILGSGDLVISGGGGGSSTFTGLTDTPSSYLSHASKVVRVNLAENALEFVSVGTAAYSNATDFASSNHTHTNATTSAAGFMSATDKVKLDASAPLASPSFTGNVILPSSTKIGAVSDIEISYLDGVTSSIQTQLNNKQPLATVLTNTTASFTTSLETKLNGIAAGAQVNVATNLAEGVRTSTTVPITSSTGSSAILSAATASLAGVMSSTDKAKLDTIASGAEVNVNADWNATSGDAQILNKPNVVTTDTDQTITSKKTITNDLVLSGDLLLSAHKAVYWGSAALTSDNAANLNFRSNAANSARINLVGAAGNFQGGVYSDNNVVGFLSNTGTVPLQVNGAGDVNITGILNGNGSGLTSLNASNLSSGTLNAARLPFAYTETSTAGALVQRNASGNVYANDYVGNTFYGSGAGLTALNASNLSSGTVPNSRLPFSYSETSVASALVQRNAAGDVYANNYVGNIFYGSGAGLGELNASNLSSGTVPNARLNSASTSGAGIVQLNNTTSSTSTTEAATANAVKVTFDLANTANTNANSISSVFNIFKASPSQTFQNIGSGGGARAINGSNGIHVLATATGNTTWTFPAPSNVDAHAITLELTNGGAFTQTWPSGTRWAGGVAPTLTASGTDVLVFTKAGTANWRGYLSSKDSK